MSRSVIGTHQDERVRLPDIVRAFALLGIILVNVQIFSNPMDAGYSKEMYPAGSLDYWAYFGVMSLFTAKSYPLFSMMFGAGLGFQMRSAANKSYDLDRYYWRRMIGLAILGCLHVTFLFLGDILITYGCIGAMLFFMRDMSPVKLAKWGAVIYAIQVLILAGLAGLILLGESYDAEQMAAALNDPMRLVAEHAAFAGPSFIDASLYRLNALPSMVLGVLIVQGCGALAFAMWGLALLKSGRINDAGHKFWRKCARWLIPGIMGSGYGAHLTITAPHASSSQAIAGISVIFLFAPMVAFGYMWLLAGIARNLRGGVLADLVSRIGSASLSAYLLQSLILSLVFCGYGLGYYGRLSVSTTIWIAALAGIASLLFVGLWRYRFARGPMEILLRRWTYWER